MAERAPPSSNEPPLQAAVARVLAAAFARCLEPLCVYTRERHCDGKNGGVQRM
jgi:hypothetical protein